MAKTRIVYFTDADDELLKYSKEMPNFSKWVKDKLMLERDTGGIEALINRLIDARLGAVKANSDTDFGQFC